MAVYALFCGRRKKKKKSKSTLHIKINKTIRTFLLSLNYSNNSNTSYVIIKKESDHFRWSCPINLLLIVRNFGLVIVITYYNFIV